jgi:hypothetical protein
MVGPGVRMTGMTEAANQSAVSSERSGCVFVLVLVCLSTCLPAERRNLSEVCPSQCSHCFEPRTHRGSVVFYAFRCFLTFGDALYQRTATFQVKLPCIVFIVSQWSQARCIWSICTRLWSFYHITGCVWGIKAFSSGQVECYAVFSEC